ncbi:MAG: beta-agarase [Bacteroidota bacterium]
MRTKLNIKIALFLIAIVLSACAKNSNAPSSIAFWENRTQTVLLDFETDSLLSDLEVFHAQIAETDQGVTKGQKALKLSLEGDEKRSGFSYKPSSPIDASSFENFALVFDAMTSSKEHSVHLFVAVRNAQGQGISRSAAIPIGKTQTCYFELAGKYLHEDTGLREDPAPWPEGGFHMKVNGTKQAIDFSQIASISFYIQYANFDKDLTIDNVRLVETPPKDPNYLVGIVDKYGQNAKHDFPGKIISDEQLEKLATQELQELKEKPVMADRSRFGGWKEGPKLEATGFFRTEKLADRWALVDPEGYLFYSNGIANVRMANTTSFTGIDFKNDTVRYRDPEDVTPEDSRGMVALGEEVTTTAYVAYPERNKMFLDLPSYDSPLANHYSYRRESHMGPFAHGETYSHYQANLERRYGEERPGAHLDQWHEITLDRFLSWGFTSFGNWAAAEFYDMKRMPYFANGWIIGDFKTVRSGLDYWGPMPDVYDPEFARRVGVTIKVVAEEVKNSPWCIGVFIDNEKSWGIPGTPKGQYGIILYALAKDADDSPIKAEIMRSLKAKYQTISKLNAAWETKITSWQVLANGIDYREKGSYSEAMIADFSVLLEAYASQYFAIVHDALAAEMPNHLYMGCRFASWGMGPEVRKAAKKYVDVFSYNYYHESLGVQYWKFLEEIDRPSVIGEFHIGTMEAGLFHPGLVQGVDQDDRAQMYTTYLESVIDNPYFVGSHWFQYIDSPLSGRAHDGENYNVGFVRNTDVPYAPMVEAARNFNQNLYQRKYPQE